MNEMTVSNLNRLATEINTIQDRTQQVVLSASIAIGRRLKEAKNLVEHGEWGEWLEANVNYSQSTANNLVKLYNEYGAEQQTLFADAKSEVFENLSYTQAVALLGIPADQREEFIENNDIDNMTTRELQDAIKAKNKAEKEVEKKKAELKEVSMNLHHAENDIIAAKKRIEELEEAGASDGDEELEAAKSALQEKVRENEKQKEKIKELKAKLEEKPKVEIKEVVPEETEKELARLRDIEKKQNFLNDNSPLMIEFKLQIANIIGDIKKLQSKASEIAEANSEEGAKCQKAIAKLMQRVLEEVT